MCADKEIRTRILDVIRILDGEGLFEMSTGHVSARVGEKIYILGHLHHKGKVLSEVTPSDIVVMDMNGNLLEGDSEPPGERYIHTAIYKARPDVQAVVHNHPRLGTAFSVAGIEILPVTHRSAFFAPKVPILMYPGQINTPELGDKVANALGNGRSVLLQGHGAVSVGSTLEEVCVVAIALEVTAQIQLIATQLGKVNTVTEYVQDGVIVGLDADEVISIPWSYYYWKHVKTRAGS